MDPDTSSKRIVLIGGGVRSGKSAFALRHAQSLGQRRVFVATAQAFDDEMSERIARHRDERGDAFDTIESPTELIATLDQIQNADVVVVDCLTLWLSNLLLRDDSADAILKQVDALVETLSQRRFHAIVVTNEVGMGIVPEHALGRLFRDLAGGAHQRLSARADEIYVGIMGSLLRLKPGPVEIQA